MAESKSKKSISPIYLNQFLRGVAFSLFGIFIPIYFLTLGYSLSEIFTYFLIFHVVTFLAAPLAIRLSKSYGYKKIMISSSLLVITSLFLLNSLDEFKIPIIFAVVYGLAEGLYYMPLHAFFTRLGENEKRGTQVSNYNSIGQIAGLITPIIGALIVTFYGFSFLFIFSILFVIISFLPLLSLENIKPKTKFSITGVRKLTNKHKKYFFGEIADSIKIETEAHVWTIFIFITFREFLSVGKVVFLIGAGSVLFTLFVGRHFDKKDKYFLMKLGGILYATTWILRIFSTGPYILYSISLLAGFFAIMISVPFNAIFYNKAGEDSDTDEFIFFREIPTFIGRAFLWIILIFVADKFTIAFALAALASLFFTFFKFEKSK